MKKIFILLILLIFTVHCAPEKNQITITILYDNYAFIEDVKTEWGFSCIIEGTEKTILFDTGTIADTLFYNIDKLKVNPEDVELVVISHIHNDHTGGLLPFLEKNNRVSVYLPVSFPDEFVEKVEKTKAKVVSVDKPLEICKNVFLTGEMGTKIIEQSIILDTDKGLIVITGCAHPGIVNIVKKAKSILDKDIYLVFGGFHLLRLSDDEVKEVIGEFRDLGVMNVGATHCTGDKAIELFKNAYGKNFVEMGVGKVLKDF